MSPRRRQGRGNAKGEKKDGPSAYVIASSAERRELLDESARKVVNALVREYGKPRRIKIEMAREVQGSRQQREELHWKQLENEKRNDEVRKRLAEDIGIVPPRRDDVIKYKLWEECSKTCPWEQIERSCQRPTLGHQLARARREEDHAVTLAADVRVLTGQTHPPWLEPLGYTRLRRN